MLVTWSPAPHPRPRNPCGNIDLLPPRVCRGTTGSTSTRTPWSGSGPGGTKSWTTRRGNGTTTTPSPRSRCMTGRQTAQLPTKRLLQPRRPRPRPGRPGRWAGAACLSTTVPRRNPLRKPLRRRRRPRLAPRRSRPERQAAWPSPLAKRSLSLWSLTVTKKTRRCLRAKLRRPPATPNANPGRLCSARRLWQPHLQPVLVLVRARARARVLLRQMTPLPFPATPHPRRHRLHRL